MASSESVEQNKQQEGAKDEVKKPIEIKEEDLVCTIETRILFDSNDFFRLVRRR